MNELKFIYIVYVLIAILCVLPEIVGFMGLAEQHFESGPQFSGLHTRFKINLGFILFGLIVQISVIASLLSSRNVNRNSR